MSWFWKQTTCYAQDSKCSLLPGQFSASKFSPGVFETLEAPFGAVLKAIHSDICSNPRHVGHISSNFCLEIIRGWLNSINNLFTLWESIRVSSNPNVNQKVKSWNRRKFFPGEESYKSFTLICESILHQIWCPKFRQVVANAQHSISYHTSVCLRYPSP